MAYNSSKEEFFYNDEKTIDPLGGGSSSGSSGTGTSGTSSGTNINSGSQILTNYYTIYVFDSESLAPISGATVTWKNPYDTTAPYMETTTDENGLSTRTLSPNKDLNCPTYFNCDVSAVGYTSVIDQEVRAEDNPMNTSPVRLEPKPTYYYICTVYKKDTSTPIENAEVEVYLRNTFQTSGYTTSSGKFYYALDTDIRNVYFQVSKSGYNTSSRTKISSTTNSTDPGERIDLETSTKYTYYYNFTVTDVDNNPIQGAKIRLYKKDDTPYHKIYTTTDAEKREEILYTIKSQLSNWGVPDYLLADDVIESYDFSIFNNQDEADSFMSDVYQELELSNTERIYLGNNYTKPVTRYSYTCPSCKQSYTSETQLLVCPNCGYLYRDNEEIIEDPEIVHDSPNVGDLVDYIISIADNDIPKTIYTMLRLGVFIDLGEYEIPPANINVKGISLPSGYEWYVQTVNCTPATSKFSNVAQLYATVTTPDDPEQPDEPVVTYYYYRFMVFDEYTNAPIEGVTATFYSPTGAIVEYVSDKNGYVGLPNSSLCRQLSVAFSKSNGDYGNVRSLPYAGFTNSSDYYRITLRPENSVCVKYGDTIPAPNIKVIIGYFDDSGKRFNEKICFTNENGYIETIDGGYFSSKVSYYAFVDDYNIKKLLVAGHNPIDLSKYAPVPEEEDGEVDKYEQFNELSVNMIKKIMASEKKVTYDNIDYKINILDPDTINVYDIFTSVPVMMYDDTKSVIGSTDMALKSNINDLRLKMINRYSGYYNPIFKDILFYNNFELDSEGSEKDECLYSNTSFDDQYQDGYGKFGVIDNMWFHKVNDNKDIEIINTLTPYYPLTGQFALDFRDYNIFDSNWDVGYYTRQVDVNTSQPCDSISSMKNRPCMFGSKYLNVPETIEITNLSMGDDENWNGEWNDEWITNPDGCPGEMMYKEINNNSVNFYFFFKKRILRYFREKLGLEFAKYINPYKSFGMEGLNDDIDEYVTKNILKLYTLDGVRLFVKRTKMGGHNSKIENDYTSQLNRNVAYYRQHGFIEVNTMTMTKMNRDDFDRKIVYNLRNGMKEEFGFAIKLKKI